MQVEDYFNFLAPDDIRIRGHRIGIESVLYEYIFREQTPEAIQRRYPSLTLEQVYASILPVVMMAQSSKWKSPMSCSVMGLFHQTRTFYISSQYASLSANSNRFGSGSKLPSRAPLAPFASTCSARVGTGGCLYTMRRP